jgi:lipocalin
VTSRPRKTVNLAGVLLLLPACARAQSVSAIPKLDKASLVGSWYEAARLPNKREKHCAADAIELIALGDKPTQLQLVDACTDVKGYKDSWNFTTVKDNGSGALKVRTYFPLTRKYWVVAVGPIVPVTATPAAKKEDPTAVSANPASSSTTATTPDASAGGMPAATAANGAVMPHIAPPPPPPSTGYAWTLIGTPNHKSLWIYTRELKPSDEELASIRAQAAAMGFDVSKLISGPQSK